MDYEVMDSFLNSQPLGPAAPIAEVLLAETAIRIELPPSQHALAVERFGAIRKHIERPTSPLFDKVAWFYPQGSMAIRATIKSRKRDEGFDIDIVAELKLPNSMTPESVLDLLFDSVKGPAGSKYHDMVERQSRCVTVHYADGMHLDITPSILIDESDPRKSWIFHAKKGEATSQHYRHVTNSWAFCDAFNAQNPPNISFSLEYARRAQIWDEKLILADADVRPVPSHSTIEGGKSTSVVALQLLKRNRNVRYAPRENTRMPPSVMMAKFASETEVPGASIVGALDAISSAILEALLTAERNGSTVEVFNPQCHQDCFTDRWPENRSAQRMYIDDLKLFKQQLTAITSSEFSLSAKKDLLVAMFGEGPANMVINEYAASIGRSVETGHRSIASTGRVLPVAGAAATSTPASSAPRNHTFYGSTW